MFAEERGYFRFMEQIIDPVRHASGGWRDTVEFAGGGGEDTDLLYAHI